MIGIYKITNKINGKCYVGQSIHIKKRFQEHIKSKFDTPLCKAFKKYGIENFDFEIIEECKKQELNEKEIYYIKIFHSCVDEHGYNLTYGGDGNMAGVSDITKNKLSECRKGENNPMFGRSLSKESLAQRSIIYKNTLKNMTEEQRQQWFNHISMSQKGKIISDKQRQKISKSLKEFYKNHPEKRQEIGEKSKGRKHSKEFCEKMRKIKTEQMKDWRKRLMQYDLQGNYIATYDGLSEAEEKTGVIRSSISKCCIGKMHTAGGYKWKYDEEFNNKYRKLSFRPITPKKPLKGYAKHQPKQWKKVYQYDKDWNYIKTFDSLTQAADEYGIKSVISKVCLGKRPSAYGYRWSYDFIEKNDIII